MDEKALIAGGVAATAGKLAYDVLGLTAKYLGSELRDATKAGVKNLNAIFQIAKTRLDTNPLPNDGSVPPRILRSVLNEGFFCEDPIQQNYLGGILASSKSMDGIDDRGASFVSVLAGLSTYQIRTHFLCYSAVLRITDQRQHDVSRWIFRHGLTILIEESSYQRAMLIEGRSDASDIGAHAFLGLNVRGLVEEGVRTIDRTAMPKRQRALRLFQPTQAGVELFLWGLGFGLSGLDSYTPDILSILEDTPYLAPLESNLGKVTLV